MSRDILIADFDRSLGDVVFRNGHRVPIQRADMGAVAIARKLEHDPANEGLQRAFLLRILRGATDEDLAELNEESVAAISLRCQEGIREVEELLGESLGASRTDTSDSPREILTDTSVTASQALTG